MGVLPRRYDMEKCETFQTFNIYGEKSKVIEGQLFEHHGPCIPCRDGLVIQAADIIPADGGNNLTVYVAVTTEEIGA